MVEIPVLSDLKDKLVELHRNYGIDKIELGKIMIIASTTLLIVSIHATLTLQSVSQDLDSASDSLNQASSLMQTDRVQQGVQALKNLQGSSIANSLSTVLQAFESSESAVNKVNAAQASAERNYKIYQWLTLLAIIGEVMGIAVIYV